DCKKIRIDQQRGPNGKTDTTQKEDLYFRNRLPTRYHRGAVSFFFLDSTLFCVPLVVRDTTGNREFFLDTD
ncbi:MAG: hypothetical protein M1461_03905, partial [Nitrospirae bacterium]|nr:hypothetical protein [Nitrospirota bacterium]